MHKKSTGLETTNPNGHKCTHLAVFLGEGRLFKGTLNVSVRT
jgi:hypothetical protein